MTDAADSDRERLKAFTGQKLDWMSALCADPRIGPRAFQVGFCIAQHINRETGLAILCDDTIRDKTGIANRWIARARNELRDAGWIDWRRTRTANVYTTSDGPMNMVIDRQMLLKEERDERREKRKSLRQELPPVAYLKSEELPPVAEQDLPPVAEQDLPPVADKHLSNYTVDITPSKLGLSIEEQTIPPQPDSEPITASAVAGPAPADLPPAEEPLPAVAHPQLAEMRLIDELGDGDPDRGVEVAAAIGGRRFEYLRSELMRGHLYPSAIRAASRCVRGVAA
ncbi:hypothetical protein BJ122_10593 [Rhodopseudomonas faecalis]|uniref:Helix-turn-helix protein n=1 Tax=Rhodopseudomonas faecalis TaxID=99655 RepID=A0A318TGL0_9BRAD|nr:hypothetical protein [Rhodopseudomonas faecalis]PYF03836.1 hypothetical protein BJ122_10593 [Rhodopseudomonas faecalis]